MGMTQEFVDFLKKFGVIGLAVAVVIGGTVQKLVSAFVADLIMPVIGLVIPNGDWRLIVIPIGRSKLLVGDFLGAMLDFLIIALVVFVLVKTVVKEAPAK